MAHSFLAVNPLVGKIVKEAKALSGPSGIMFQPPPAHPDEDASAYVGTLPPEERTEVDLAREILRSCVPIESGSPAAREAVERIKRAAYELLKMHGE